MTHTNIAAFLNGPVPSVERWRREFAKNKDLFFEVSVVNPKDPVMSAYLRERRRLREEQAQPTKPSLLGKMGRSVRSVTRSFNLV